MPLMMSTTGGPQRSWITGPVFDQETVAQTLKMGVVIRELCSQDLTWQLHCPGRGVFGMQEREFDARVTLFAWRRSCRDEPVFRQR
jgi:hypothetical protein